MLPTCVFQKYEFNMDNLSKPELLTLLSIMEGELEARDLVIEALRVSHVDAPLSAPAPVGKIGRMSESAPRARSLRGRDLPTR